MFSKDNLHHAYFIEGEKEAILKDIDDFLSKAFGIVSQGNPDVHLGEHEYFGIDESRALSEMQSMKPLQGERKIFIISIRGITSEAQNSLLKVFEEPTPGTHFFIISSSKDILLPTLRSRLVVISHPSAKNVPQGKEAKDFISAGPKKRLEYIADMIEEKDKSKAEAFLNAIISELYKDGVEKHSSEIKEILQYYKYMKDRSPSLKLILERIALLDL